MKVLLEENEHVAQLLNGNEVITPSETDSALAKEFGQRLAARLGDVGGLRLELKTDTTSEELVLPNSALRLIMSLLTELGQGNAADPDADTSRADDSASGGPP